MRRVFQYAAVWALVLALALPAVASPGLAGSYTRRLWRAQDGLPDQTVQAFAQTPDGYLWIGTKGGLLRFDGARFVVYDHTTAPGLSESSINCLFVARDGSLWIGTEGGGLVRYRNGVFRVYPTPDGLSDSFVRAIFEDRRGVLWAGGDQGLFQVRGSKLERIDGAGGIPTVFVRAIVEDRQGRVWVGGTALLRFDGPAVREYPLPGGASANLVISMLVDRNGVMWVGTLSGLHTLSPSGALRPAGALRAAGRIHSTVIHSTVQVLRQGADGALWIGTLGQGLSVYRRGVLSAASTAGFLPSHTVLAIFRDREGNVWLGTPAGMLRLSRSPVSIVPFPNAADSQFETIYQDQDGSVWAASTYLFHIRNGIARRATFPALPRVRVRTLLRDRRGTLWIGTDGSGLYHLSGSRVMRRYTHVQGLANDFIRVLLEARDGSLWAGTDGGLSHITPSGIASYNTPSGLAYFSVTALLEDHRGDLWIGTSRGLSHLDPGIGSFARGAFVTDAVTEALKREKVWSIHEDPEGGLWFGTSNGLYCFRAGRLTRYTTEQGLASNIVYQILEDGSGALWLSAPNTVSRVDRHELEASGAHAHVARIDRQELEASGAHPHLSLTLYPIAQAFESAELYSGMQPAGFLSRQHEVWFPSNRGPVHIQIPRQPQPLPPAFPVVIDRVLADGRELPVKPRIAVAPGDTRLQISFAAILLRSQASLRYRYKLQGFDTSWNDANTLRVADYTNLPPGRYRFRVEAFETGNPAAVSETSIELEQRPRFYRTPLFLLVCLLALALAVWAVHRLRVRQVAMRFRAVIEERSRLAREMHDTLIQNCTSVSALLEAVSTLDATEEALSHELVNYARDQIRTTIDEARNAVWDLRHGEGSEQRLDTLVFQMAEQMCGRSGLSLACSAAGEAFPLPYQATHEVMMIVREALSNAHAHAHPSHIEIKLRFAEDALTLSVQDDGVGFRLTAMQAEPELHYGLIGMQERAERLGGEFRLESASGRGTAVRLRLPRHKFAAELAVGGR